MWPDLVFVQVALLVSCTASLSWTRSTALDMIRRADRVKAERRHIWKVIRNPDRIFMLQLIYKVIYQGGP